MSKLMELVENLAHSAIVDGELRASDMREIRAKAQELEREAARYRWLDERIWYVNSGGMQYGYIKYEFGPTSMTPSSLGEAIDNEMEADK